MRAAPNGREVDLVAAAIEAQFLNPNVRERVLDRHIDLHRALRGAAPCGRSDRSLKLVKVRTNFNAPLLEASRVTPFAAAVDSRLDRAGGQTRRAGAGLAVAAQHDRLNLYVIPAAPTLLLTHQRMLA